MNKIYLIGDIHGRDFWKELKDNTEDLIIFVGDYVDPYTYYENITAEQALENFKEIIEFAKSNKNVILLVGNHDCTYFLSDLICECRTDYDNFPEICNLFRDNADLFRLAYCFEYNGEKILVSHAGVHLKWFEEEQLNEDSTIESISENPEEICDYLNKKFKELQDKGYPKHDKFINDLAQVSSYRGGWSRYGSCVWSDVHEWIEVETYKDPHLNCYQIFGHTQLKKGYPLIGKTFACIDSKEIYALDYILEKRKENINKNEDI